MFRSFVNNDVKFNSKRFVLCYDKVPLRGFQLLTNVRVLMLEFICREKFVLSCHVTNQAIGQGSATCFSFKYIMRLYKYICAAFN